MVLSLKTQRRLIPHLASYNGSVLSGIDDRAILSVAVKAIQELNLKVGDLQASAALSSGQTSDSLFSWILGKFSRHRPNFRAR